MPPHALNASVRWGLETKESWQVPDIAVAPFQPQNSRTAQDASERWFQFQKAFAMNPVALLSSICHLDLQSNALRPSELVPKARTASRAVVVRHLWRS